MNSGFAGSTPKLRNRVARLSVHQPNQGTFITARGDQATIRSELQSSDAVFMGFDNVILTLPVESKPDMAYFRCAGS